jgi:hypothetical protein
MLIKRLIGPLAILLLLGLVGTAQAKQFAMSGKWVQRRGVFYIPVYPNVGGIPAISGAVASVQPGGTLTVPANQFSGSWGIVFPMPQASLQQLSTQFANTGPIAAGTFKAGNWVATRPNANFAFCPGATANPTCLTHKSTATGAPSGSGTMHGIVKYTAGASQYGGTMQMLSGGGGTIGFVIGNTGPTIAHRPFGAGLAGDTEGPGGPYANRADDILAGGIVTRSPGISLYGLITVPGAYVSQEPFGATWYIHGFPWTTGKVYVRGTVAGPNTSTTVTLTGSKSLTPNGAGNITMVAGGISNAQHVPTTYVSFDYVQMKLTFPVNPLPSMTPAGVAAGALLMVLVVGYAVRRRL